MSELRKYGVLLTIATAVKVVLYKQDGLTYATGGDVTLAAGDVTISKDNGSYVNVTNLPVSLGQSWYIILTAAELQASTVSIMLSDQTATQLFLDSEVHIEVYGNASALHAFDLDTASVAQTGDSYARIGAPVGASISVDLADVPTVAEFNARTLLAASYFDFTTDNVIVGTNNDKSGYSLTQAFPANFSDMAITVTTGNITVGTNNDKTGYSISGTKQTLDALNDIAATAIVSGGAINTTTGAVDNVTTISTNNDKTGYALTQAFPANFANLIISIGGRVDSLVQGYLNTSLTETTAGRIAGNFDTFFENADVATTKTVDDVGGAGGTSDWTTTERNEIRGRLGITGTTAAGGNTPTLSLQATVDLVKTETDKIQTVLVDTNELQTNQGNWLTATGFSTHTAANVRTEMDVNSTKLAEITAARMSELDAATAGKMANQIDIIQTDTTTDIPALINGLNDPTAAAIAAAVSAYDMGNGRTIKEALSFLRNKWAIIGGTLTVYDTDDTTILWTSVMTQTAGNPVSSSDPV